jgi:hypothetical protein
MRRFYVRSMVAGAVMALFIPALTLGQGPNIAGTYALYREGDLCGKVVGCMVISQQSGGSFSIGVCNRMGNPAMDWQGNGEVAGNRGFYLWRFDDGKQGRTDFTIDNERNLHGHVQGPGINWKYVARRQ